LSCIVEVAAFHRPFIPWLGWPMVAVVALSTVVRWWCVSVLGKHWNPRLIVIPGASLVHRGPYRWLHHPNYTAVTVEVAALPLVHSAWLTAVVFSIANALVLNVRIRAENSALGYA
jgi:methyltransferase